MLHWLENMEKGLPLLLAVKIRATTPQRGCGHRSILLEIKRSNKHHQDSFLILDVHT